MMLKGHRLSRPQRVRHHATLHPQNITNKGFELYSAICNQSRYCLMRCISTISRSSSNFPSRRLTAFPISRAVQLGHLQIHPSSGTAAQFRHLFACSDEADAAAAARMANPRKFDGPPLSEQVALVVDSVQRLLVALYERFDVNRALFGRRCVLDALPLLQMSAVAVPQLLYAEGQFVELFAAVHHHSRSELVVTELGQLQPHHHRFVHRRLPIKQQKLCFAQHQLVGLSLPRYRRLNHCAFS